VSRFKKGKPLEADLALEGMESATLVLFVAPRAPSTLNLHLSTI
jgi:hypothetical protein